MVRLQGDGEVRRREDLRRRQTKPTTTLFVVNFDVDKTRERDLEKHFEPFGKLRRVQIKRNYAFIQYEDVDQAADALKACSGTSLAGQHPCHFSPSRPLSVWRALCTLQCFRSYSHAYSAISTASINSLSSFDRPSRHHTLENAVPTRDFPLYLPIKGASSGVQATRGHCQWSLCRGRRTGAP